MFVAVFIVFLLCHQVSADSIGVNFTCIDSAIDPDVSYSTFKPSKDGVQGRYTAELCTFNIPDRKHLTMDLTFNKDLRVCDPEFRKRNPFRVLRPGPQHSYNTVDIPGLTNCTHVCYSMDFDLIFSSCYLLKSTLNGESESHSPHDSYHLVSNNISFNNYNKTEPHVNPVNHPDYFTLQWILGIPAVDYIVMLHGINNNTKEYLNAEDVTQNCTLLEDVRQVLCVLAPAYGCYQAELEHGGLWVSGVFHHLKYVTHNLCLRPEAPPVLTPRSAAVWWAGGGALLCACALAGAALRRRLRLRDYHRHVVDMWKKWVNARETDTEAALARETRDSRDVLLLYAREGERGQQAAAALRDLLQHSTGGTVYDIFSPAVMAACGAAPQSWLRALLARPDVRVLLLQSPALAALYQDQLREGRGGLTLREPLLGRRVMYRAPHYGDQLLKMALRHIAETATAHHAYNKYYLATYQSLETDVLPGVVSYRRYVLPDAARVLALHLAGAPPDVTRLQHAAQAAHALVQHVQHHPDYLMDEIFIH